MRRIFRFHPADAYASSPDGNGFCAFNLISAAD